MTVLGPVAPEELGVTQVHEHLLIDARCLWHEPQEQFKKSLVEEPVSSSNLWLNVRDSTISKDNLRLDDAKMLTEELTKYKRFGGGSLVELTPPDLGRDPVGMRAISRRSGVHIICGCGHYVEHCHPADLSRQTVDEVASRLVSEITEGISGTDVKPGIIGEVGTSSPITRQEVKVLRAAARAHIKTGAPINVHLSHPRNQGHRVLDILEAEGVELDRVALSHLDQFLTPEAIEYHASLAARGANIDYDDFGSEGYLSQWTSPRRLSVTLLPRDEERVEALARLIEKDCLDRLMLSSDVFQKTNLERFGGFGYHHILRDIVPLMRSRGISQKKVDTMMVSNPSKFLAF